MRQLSLEVLRVSEARQLDKELLDTLMTIERNEVCLHSINFEVPFSMRGGGGEGILFSPVATGVGSPR